MSLDHVHIVLVRTREPQNLGAVARAMKNAGLSRLTLVNPVTDDLVTARRVAVHAQELVTSPPRVGAIADAVKDATWVVGTTSRTLKGRRSLTPREVAEEAMRRGGRVALVFGDEESGLSNDDLLTCHDLSCIPASAAQPSFNLAQSVVVYAYELHLAAAQPVPKPVTLATEEELRQVEAALREVLVASDFADADRPGHGVRELAQTLKRAALTPGEARLWFAALKRVSRAFARLGRGR
ncbi:MAG: RNA methyltransferase, partial [Myxococcales bacterium]